MGFLTKKFKINNRQNYKLRVYKKYNKTLTYLASLVEVSPQEILSISYLEKTEKKVFNYEGQGRQCASHVSKK